MEETPCCLCHARLGTYGGAETQLTWTKTCSLPQQPPSLSAGPTTLPCGHNGCVQCLITVQEWAGGDTALCPLCRRTFSATQPLAVNHLMQQLLEEAEQPGIASAPLESDPPAYEDVVMDSQSPASHQGPHAPGTEATSGNGGGFNIETATLPVWMPDNASDRCTILECGNIFTLTNPRHHCRLCGKLVCNGCSKGRQEASMRKTLLASQIPIKFQSCQTMTAVVQLTISLIAKCQ